MWQRVVSDTIELCVEAENKDKLTPEARSDYKAAFIKVISFQFIDLGIEVKKSPIGLKVIFTIKPTHACMSAACDALRSKGVFRN